MSGQISTSLRDIPTKLQQESNSQNSTSLDRAELLKKHNGQSPSSGLVKQSHSRNR